MRMVFRGIKNLPHPEETAKRSSRRTHCAIPVARQSALSQRDRNYGLVVNVSKDDDWLESTIGIFGPAGKPDPEDVRMVEEAWCEAERAVHSGEWDLVVLDEINYAMSYGMLDPAKVVEVLKTRPAMVHVILTGRNAHPSIVELADTVTEMRQVKHAYEKGVMAQRGIEY